MEQVNQLRSIESGCWNSVSMFPIKRMTHLQPQEFLNGQTAEETHRTGRLSKQDWKMLYSGRTPFSSVQFSHSVVSDSLWPQELQHTRPSCPSPTPRVHSNSRPSSQWCHPAISSSVVLFSSCPQTLPASESFPVSQFFTSGGQSIGVSASTSVFPMNT